MIQDDKESVRRVACVGQFGREMIQYPFGVIAQQDRREISRHLCRSEHPDHGTDV